MLASSKSNWALITMATASQWNNFTDDFTSRHFSRRLMCKSLSSVQCVGVVGCVQEKWQKSVPRISLLVQHSHKLFKTKAQCLSIVLFLILPQRLWHLLFFSPAFYHLMHTLLSAVPLYCFTQSCTISHELNGNTVLCTVLQISIFNFFVSFILCIFSFYSFYNTPSFQIKQILLRLVALSQMDAAYCSHHSLTRSVIITCTQLPLPSHWSRSPDSCPCSLPAPGHIQKSPYKCSHTSHLQSLLTPTGRGTLQDRQKWLLMCSWAFQNMDL